MISLCFHEKTHKKRPEGYDSVGQKLMPAGTQLVWRNAEDYSKCTHKILEAGLPNFKSKR